MLLTRPKTAGKVLLLPIEAIQPSPWQARTSFDETELTALAASIARNGLLQPVTVRQTGPGCWQLVAGERRLRACRMAGLTVIPAIPGEYADEESAALGLLENLQRQDLNPFDQARGIRELLHLWHCTQEEAARRLGLAQPTLNNKLRLLALSEEAQEVCLRMGLSERHARAVLRLPEARRTEALRQMGRQQMTARQADAYVQKLLEPPPRRPVPMVQDVRIFVNTINRAVRLMVEAGVPASAKRREGEGFIEYTVHIPTGNAKKDP